MESRKAYEITDRAGTHVAGRRIEDRAAPLQLTDAEAAYELQMQTIRPWPDKLKVGKATGEKRTGITLPADGVMREVVLDDDGDRPGPTPVAEPPKPRSKRR